MSKISQYLAAEVKDEMISSRWAEDGKYIVPKSNYGITRVTVFILDTDADIEEHEIMMEIQSYKNFNLHKEIKKVLKASYGYTGEFDYTINCG